MKKFGRAAITTFYNAQTNNTRKAWFEPEVQGQMVEILHQLLKDLHPDLKCRQLLAETDKIILNHITHQTLREFKSRCRRHLEPGEYENEEWVPEEYAYALKGSIRPLRFDKDYAEVNGQANGDGLNHVFDHNTFSPNASSPLSDSSENVKDGDAIEDMNPIPSCYASQNSCFPLLTPNDAAIDPNLNTTVNHYDTEFSMGTPNGIGAPLFNTRTMNENANTTDNFIPSPWNDTHWDAFVDTEISNPIEDIDTILRNATSLNGQCGVQVPDTTQLNTAPLNRKPEWYAFANTAPNEYASVAGGSWTAFQHAVQVSDTTSLNNTSLNSGARWNFVNYDSLPTSNTAPKEHANVVGASSAVPEQFNLPSSTGNYSVGQGINSFPSDFGNAAGYSPARSSFDLERNAAWDPNDWSTIDWTTIDWTTIDWTTIDWTTIDPSSPSLDAPHAAYQFYNATF